MNESYIYQNMLSTVIYNVLPKFDSAINSIDGVLGYMDETISVNGYSLRRTDLVNIKNELVNNRNYVNNILIPYIRRKITEATL